MSISRTTVDADGIPKLICPTCGEPLIEPSGRGRHDANGNLVPHRFECRCRWCDWFWMDDIAPMTCACGTVVDVEVDDGHAYASEVEPDSTEHRKDVTP